MRQAIDIAAAFLFSTFLAIPILGLVVFGYSSEAEKSPELKSIRYFELITPEKTYRRDMLAKTLVNSPAGIAAVQAKSYLDYEVFGFVNTHRVVSGNDGWLFYKPQFAKNLCDEKLAMNAVDSIDAMNDIADGADINLIVAVSPDKSSVYPERLGLRAGIASKCKVKATAFWRKYAVQIHSRIIDHLAAIRTADDDVLKYYKEDTHWNDYGRAIALRQLTQKVMGTDPGLPKINAGIPKHHYGDLARMLRVSAKEPALVFPDYWNQQFRKAAGRGIPNTVILHDSFYEGAAAQLKMLFPGADMVHLDRNIQKHVAALAKMPPTIIVNSVERSFFNRVTASTLSWSSPLGKHLVERNASVARHCIYHQVTNNQLLLRDLKFGQGEWRGTRDAQILIPVEKSDNRVCMRIRFKTNSESASILYLPRKSTNRLTYSEGYSVRFPTLGNEREIEVVLPSKFAGSMLRLDPFGGKGALSNLSVEMGTLAGLSATISSMQ